jgi:hypothetical protein
MSKLVDYYNGTRTHLSLSKDAPKPRTVQLPSQGRVVKVPRVVDADAEFFVRVGLRKILTHAEYPHIFADDKRREEFLDGLVFE